MSAALTILYVEDNPDLRETIGALLEGPGREITACESAEDALAIAAGRRFDVLVTDVSLPRMSGIDLARRFLAIDPQQCIVLCTGFSLALDVVPLGSNVSTLTKPFELEELEAVLERIDRDHRNR